MTSCMSTNAMTSTITSTNGRTVNKFITSRSSAQARPVPRVTRVAAAKKDESAKPAVPAQEEPKGIWRTTATVLASVAAAQLVAFPVPGMTVAGIMGDSATDPMERAAEDPVDRTSNLPSIGQVQKSVRQAQAISNTTDDPKLQAEKGSPSNVVQGMKEVKDQVGNSGLPDVGAAVKNVLPDLSAVADDPLNQTSAGPSKRQVEVNDNGKETAISNSNPYAEGKLQGGQASPANAVQGAKEAAKDQVGKAGLPDVGKAVKNAKNALPDLSAINDPIDAPNRSNKDTGGVDTANRNFLGSLPKANELARDSDDPGRVGELKTDLREEAKFRIGLDNSNSGSGDPIADKVRSTAKGIKDKYPDNNALSDLSAADQAGYEGGNVGVPDPRNSELESPVPTNTTNRDNKDLGPNEVGQDFIRSLPYASNADTAAPGRAPGSATGAGGPSSGAERAAQVNKATENVIGGAQGVADKIVGNQPKESTYSQSGGPWNWLFPRTKQTLKNVLPDLSELPPAATNTDNRDNRNLGPNEVGKDLLGGLPNASKADTAAPGRSGDVKPNLVQEAKNQVGKGQDSGVSGSQLSGSGDSWKDLGDKVKNALPDLSELPSAAINTSNRDNKNLGPNEVGKDLLGGLPNASKTDTATPGRAGGSGDFIGDRIAEATDRFAPEALKEGDDGATKAASDKIKNFLNIGNK